MHFLRKYFKINQIFEKGITIHSQNRGYINYIILPGLLNPLDCPHHMRIDDNVPYREGVTLNRPVKGGGSFVNCGMRKEVKIDKLLKPNVRVTVRLDPYNEGIFLFCSEKRAGEPYQICPYTIQCV